MKTPLLFSLAALPLLLTACETDPLDRHPRPTSFAARSDYYYDDRDRSYRQPYPRDVAITQRASSVSAIGPSQPYQRATVTAPPRAPYRPRAEVRYYLDPSGRYYFQGARRIYTNAGTHTY
jgi:hypothetical protein